MGYAMKDGKKVWKEPTKKWKKVRESQGIKQPKKPKDVKSSGTYGGRSGGSSSGGSSSSSSSGSSSSSSSERDKPVYTPGNEKKSYLGNVKKQQTTKKSKDVKSSRSSSRSSSSSERTKPVYTPGNEKKSYLGNVKKQQTTKKTSKPKKDELAGFKKRLSNINKFEKKLAMRTEQAEDKFRYVPGLKGDSWLSKVGRDVLAFPERFALGAFGAIQTVTMKSLATAEGLLRKDTRKAVVEELGSAGKKTPKAFQQTYVNIEKVPYKETISKPVFQGDRKKSFSPTQTTKTSYKTKISVSPQQAVNIATTLGSVALLGSMKSYQRGVTTKPGSTKVTSQKTFKTPKGRRVVSVEKGSFRNLKGQKFTYKTRSSINPKTAQGTYRTTIKTPTGKISVNKGQIIPKSNWVGPKVKTGGWRNKAGKLEYTKPKVSQKFYQKTKFTSKKGPSRTTEQFGTKTLLDTKKLPGRTIRTERIQSQTLSSPRGKSYKVATARQSASTSKITRFRIKSVKVPQSKLKFKFSDTRLNRVIKLQEYSPRLSKGKFSFNLKQIGKKGSVSIGRSRGGIGSLDPSSRFTGGFGKIQTPSSTIPKISPGKPAFTQLRVPASVPLPGSSPAPVVPIVPFNPAQQRTELDKITKPKDSSINKGITKPVTDVEDVFRPGIADLTDPGVKPGDEGITKPGDDAVPGTDTTGLVSTGGDSRITEEYYYNESASPIQPAPSAPLKKGPVPPIIKRTGVGGSVFSGFFGGRTKGQRKGKYAPSLRASSFNITTSKPVKGSFTGLTERPVIKRSRSNY